MEHLDYEFILLRTRPGREAGHGQTAGENSVSAEVGRWGGGGARWGGGGAGQSPAEGVTLRPLERIAVLMPFIHRIHTFTIRC